jgi:drug/metabolite transporter (DMT)-like permease
MSATPSPSASSVATGGVWLLLAGATLISFSGVWVKLAHVPPTISGFYRMAFGGLILLALVLSRGGSLLPGRSSLDRVSWGLGAACGVFFSLDLFFWHRSVFLVGPGLSTLLSNFQVFFLAAAGALFMGERLGPRLVIAVPMALIGLSLVVGLHQGLPDADYRWGVFLGLITAVCYAAYLLTLRRMQSRPHPPGLMAGMAVISLICAGILGLAGWAEELSFAIGDSQSWLALIAYGLASQVLAWVLISKGLPRTPASRAGLVLLLQPTLAFVWDILFFARPTDWLGGLGAVLALGAIYLGATPGPAK